MNVNKDIRRFSPTMPQGVDDAGGVPGAKWFVAIVNNRCEKAGGDKLSKIGIKNYVPIQTVYKVWRNGKKAKVDKVVIPAIIFIHCTEKERREIVKLPYIFRFMTNKAGVTPNALSKPLAVISNKEINQLKFMLGQSDIPVTITDRLYRVGDKVKIIRGGLAGLEGEVFDTGKSKSEVMITLDSIGFAKVLIDTVNLKFINK